MKKNFWSDCEAVKPRIYSLLKECPNLRDSDEALMSEVWKTDIRLLQEEMQEALRLLSEKKLTHPESITRMRRKLQEECEELRGDLWAVRHQLEGLVQSEIRQMTFFDLPGFNG